MIGTIRKHSKWLWGIVITATIVTFVFWGSSTSSGPGGRAPKIDLGRIDGEAISQEDYAQAAREANLAFYFRYRDWPDRIGKRVTNFDEERARYEQLFWVHKLKQYNVQVDDASVARAARGILQATKHATLDDFVQKELLPHADESDLQRYISHELGVQQLREVIGLSGDVVTPAEARTMYVHDHQALATDAVFFSSSNYLAAVPAPASNVLVQFFVREQAVYRVPDRVQVKYVEFDATNFLAVADQQLAKLTNLDASIDQEYLKRGTNYYPGVKSPEEAKQKIRDEVRHGMALTAARKKAEEFTEYLYNLQPLRVENLAVVAATNGLTVKVSQPFDEAYGPSEFDGGPTFAARAFALTPDEPFTEQPPVGTNAVFVIAFDKKIPSEVPPLESIRDRVIADYKASQALLLAQQAGMQFARAVTNGLAQGKTFSAICADAKVKRVTVPPFSLSATSVPEIEEQMELNGYSDRRYLGYKQLAFATPPGKVSDFSPTPEGGVVIYVAQRLALDPAKMQADLPAYYENLRLRRKQEAFYIWFQREIRNSLRDIPLLQNRQTSASPG